MRLGSLDPRATPVLALGITRTAPNSRGLRLPSKSSVLARSGNLFISLESE
jgi:hypothetical protein